MIGAHPAVPAAPACAFALLFSVCSAPLTESTMMQETESRERLLEVAREVMVAAGNCALVTLDDGGAPQARAMDPFPPEPDLTVWMATRRETRKVAQLRADPRATLYYFDREGGGYVTLVGTARIVDDSEDKARYWKDAWSAFYDDANRGDDYVLVQFEPLRAEIVSLRHGVASAPKAWKPAVLVFR